MMEGDSPELEIDSELVMSFYDQYQVPLYLDENHDLAIARFSSFLADPALAFKYSNI